MPDNDYDLLLRCLRKELEAERQLYNRYSAGMYGLCLRYASSETEAQDFLQEGFFRLFSSLDKYRFEGNMDTWVSRIFVTTAINHLKKYGKPDQEVELDEELIEFPSGEDILAMISVRELVTLIQRLPPAYRMVFNMFILENYRHREIAEMLGINEGTSKTRLFRAKVILRKMIKDLMK